MTRRQTNRPLGVWLNSRAVGTLQRDPDGAIAFRYGHQWLAWEGNFPISLSLPLREERYAGALVSAVFDNLLPDSDVARRRIAERVGADRADVYSLLSALGQDCVGALQFLSEELEPGIAGGVEGRPLTTGEIAQLLANLAAAPLGVGDDDAFRISLAGAQEKTALLRHDGRWLMPTGATATTHIFKPQIGQLPNGVDLSDSVENEYLCLRLMAALGVPAARAEITEFDGRRTLIVERFDRRWTEDGRLLRLPQEDCCQALSVLSSRKYQSDGGPGMRAVIDLLKGSDAPGVDVRLFLRASILFWMLSATDGHAKNFSIFISSGGRFRLAPVYDVLTAQPSFDTGRIARKNFRLAMSVGKNRHYAVNEILPRHFLQTAALAGVDDRVVRSLLEELGDTVSARAQTVFDSLPDKFPSQLVASVSTALAERSRLLMVD